MRWEYIRVSVVVLVSGSVASTSIENYAQSILHFLRGGATFKTLAGAVIISPECSVRLKMYQIYCQPGLSANSAGATYNTCQTSPFNRLSRDTHYPLSIRHPQRLSLFFPWKIFCMRPWVQNDKRRHLSLKGLEHLTTFEVKGVEHGAYASKRLCSVSRRDKRPWSGYTDALNPA